MTDAFSAMYQCCNQSWLSIIHDRTPIGHFTAKYFTMIYGAFVRSYSDCFLSSKKIATNDTEKPWVSGLSEVTFYARFIRLENNGGFQTMSSLGPGTNVWQARRNCTKNDKNNFARNHTQFSDSKIKFRKGWRVSWNNSSITSPLSFTIAHQ